MHAKPRSITVNVHHTVILLWLFHMQNNHQDFYILTQQWGGWQRGKVVRTSIFSRRTFPDLFPINSWQVTTRSVNCLLWVIQLGQLSLSSLRGW